jgi:predicted dehydrogenase
VLRYAPLYQQVKQIMDSGEIGEIINIQATEGVAYWHQAHSYVRGNWRRKCDSSPMILAKCCHDMDLFLWLTGRHCKSVSSVGSLRHFKADNAPEGAPLRCTDGCPAADSCPYNAVRFYLGGVDSGKKDWPINVLAVEPTHDSILDALKNGPYGRCVYHCDNDVVDHQIVNLEMEDELTVSFTMTGFSAINGRRINVMGTHGEIRGDMDENIIRVMPFAKEAYTIDVKTISNDFSGHGGGDARLMDDFLRLVSGEGTLGGALTSIDRSVESHLVALAAEKSRMEGGKLIRL